jgi:hypothetical protein
MDLNQNKMSQLEVSLNEIKTTVRGSLRPYYAEPTLEIKGTIRSGNDQQVGLASIQFDVRLIDTPNLTSLSKFQLFIINIPKKSDDSKEFNAFFSFGLNSANAIHDMIKSMERGYDDRIVFDIQLSGFSIGLNNNFENISFNQTSHNLEFHVVDYISLLSKYYNNLSWILISRDTYSLLKGIADKKGLISMDEIIKDLIDTNENERHEK